MTTASQNYIKKLYKFNLLKLSRKAITKYSMHASTQNNPQTPWGSYNPLLKKLVIFLNGIASVHKPMYLCGRWRTKLEKKFI